MSDTSGLPHAILVTAVNVTDRNRAVELFENNKEYLSSVKNAMLDGGYAGAKFAAKIKTILGAEAEIAKRSELHTRITYTNYIHLKLLLNVGLLK